MGLAIPMLQPSKTSASQSISSSSMRTPASTKKQAIATKQTPIRTQSLLVMILLAL
jgi:hypothetical protein